MIQDTRLASEAMEREARDAWTQSAFVGWQLMGSMGGKVPPFKKYLRSLGIKEPKEKITREQVEREKKRAYEALALVERVFDGKESGTE